MHFASRMVACAVASLAVAAPAVAAPIVRGEPAIAAKAAAIPQRRLGTVNPPRVELAPVTAGEVERLRSANRRNAKRLLVGITRRVASGGFAWQPVPGGYAAQLAVRSPQAGALRLAIELANLPPEVEMVFFGSDSPDRLAGPVRLGDLADRTQAWWTPITDGDSQTVEVFVPTGIDPRSLTLRVSALSHIFTTLASRFEKRTAEIGDSGACNVDVQCSPLAGSQAFLDARNAVAQMVFVDGGFTGICTGTLLNDTDRTTQVPWFFSANHCFENESTPFKSPGEMQAVANTLNTLWFFEAASCNDRSVPAFAELGAGATFVYNNPGADALLLRLAGNVPSGAFFAGWDANAVAIGSPVVTIHHPQGDLKKVSQGTVTRYSSPPVSGGATTPFSEVHWSSGTTEAGSSGSGLFTFDGSQYALRGALWGGAAQCANPNGADNYSRFDRFYPALAPYLDPPVSAAVDYSDIWWNAGESGWGLNLVQHTSRNIFGVWYTYADDGKRTWYVMPGGTWTDANTFTGTLYATTAPAANMTFDAMSTRASPVGSGTLRFSDARNATWSYSVNGVSGTRAITRQSF